MGLLSDLKIVYHCAIRPIRGQDHAARMESFYAGQADAYDDFRKRLLHGREELWRSIDVPPGAIWVDMGGGTGANLECLGPRIESLGQVYLVDLSPSMLSVARQRIEKHGWKNVQPVQADATAFRPPQGSADVVTFSYSLTMIPDWIAAVENARAILKPGGVLGVVDFYVSCKHPAEGLRRHGWFTRLFWPAWFARDNVFPSPDHLPWLRRQFEPVHCREGRGGIPYVPLLRPPYYVFVGRKPRLGS
jgi:S-adenosylmethionine-diacylgycerolhomoserine-N-methlytransferase